MKHDEFSRHEDDARDLIEALSKLSHGTQASLGFRARVMAQADQLSTPRRGALAWLSDLLLWPASLGWQVVVAALCLVVMIGAVSQYVTWIRAGLMGVPSGLLHEAQLQEQLWQKKFRVRHATVSTIRQLCGNCRRAHHGGDMGVSLR